MPPQSDPNAPAPKPQEPSTAAPATGAPDLSKILLPKKEPPTGGPDTAQRINAAELLSQESTATLIPPKPADTPPAPIARLKPPAPPTPPAAPATTPSTAPLSPLAQKPPVGFEPQKPAEESGVSSLQTYKGDLQKVVVDKGVSVVSVAAAEAERRGKEPLVEATPEEKASRGNTILMIAGGITLLALAAAVIGVLFLRPTSVPVPQSPEAPFLSVDETSIVTLTAADNTRTAVATKLQAARQGTRLPLGLINWVFVGQTSPDNTALEPVELQALLAVMSPNVPAELLRVLQGLYLFGVHSFDENQPFLLFRVDSYETAYAAMLLWERTLRSDLTPVFARNPSPRAAGSPVPEAPTQFLQTGFVDQIVENRDVRLIRNEAGDILLLWTFLGRDTILITTNEYTLREVVSRINTAPVVPIPGR